MRSYFPFVLFALCFGTLIAPVGFPEALSAGADRLATEEGEGFEVRSSPSGASVFVDGIRRGKTPLSIDDLAPGEHRLVLMKEGYETRSLSFNLKAGVRMIAFLELEATTGLVRFSASKATETARPFMPVFLIDGEAMSGSSARLGEGPHRIRARAFGFMDEERAVVVERNRVTELAFALKPAPFGVRALRLERRRVNPANPGLLGESVLVFEASGPGMATVKALDRNGALLLSLSVGPFETWTQRMSIVARNEDGTPWADGTYELRLEAESVPWDGEDSVIRTGAVSLAVDSSAIIRPATSSSGVGGLLFAPETTTLPAASFQMELGILGLEPYGNSSGGDPAFAASLRFAPSDGWELAAAALVAQGNDGSSVEFGASVRRAFLKAGGAIPLRSAFSLRYGTLSVDGRSAFGLARGVEAAFPVELGAAGPFVLLTPSASWTTAADEVPSAALSAGFGWRGRSWTAAFSGRTDFDLFSGALPGPEAAILGLELKLYPPPSVLVFSAFGGAWLEGGKAGAFAGAGFGILL
ncbi:MAG TPA: hypothetical protein DIC34_17525 [Treponema sp.]|nr:MAG: hypothetical protein A2001_15330 [Treponema sp. GWC1_61_84]HCM28302.1 hypothetical protein [Treponema sp.]